MGDHKFLKEWKAEQTRLILQVHPITVQSALKKCWTR